MIRPSKWMTHRSPLSGGSFEEKSGKAGRIFLKRKSYPPAHAARWDKPSVRDSLGLGTQPGERPLRSRLPGQRPSKNSHPWLRLRDGDVIEPPERIEDYQAPDTRHGIHVAAASGHGALRRRAVSQENGFEIDGRPDLRGKRATERGSDQEPALALFEQGLSLCYMQSCKPHDITLTIETT